MSRKTTNIHVRYGFNDQVMSLSDSMSGSKEICSCVSFVVGYEDEHGEECNNAGVYLDQKVDKAQQAIYFS